MLNADTLYESFSHWALSGVEDCNQIIYYKREGCLGTYETLMILKANGELEARWKTVEAGKCLHG